ncbi:MAG TPA: DUF2252 domain-containing protein, partial [Gaiellales bacterium]|nr:DUF2252 domain-containing protein [Gaiellales bacterium]
MSTTESESDQTMQAGGRRGRRVVSHPTVAQRTAVGRDARARVPRSSHAAFEPPSTRPDPVSLLESQAPSRVAELVPIRYGRMLVSPFAFYRGAALIMASDLSTGPNTGLRVQLCGDAHLSNFGVFASPERRLVFDLNDFDETLPGPFEWDVKRLAASMEVAGRDSGFTGAQRRAAVLDTVASYRGAMRTFAGMRALDVWYARIDVDDLVAEFRDQVKKGMVKRTEKALAKARTRDSMTAFSKLTAMVDGEPQIVSDPPLIERIADMAPGQAGEELFERLHQLTRRYRQSLQSDRRVLLEQFRLADFARKVVGVGSVGTRAWIGLLLGRDEQDPLFLQFKEAQPSVLEAFLGKSEYANHGERVVTGQHLMQASSDIFLGWVHVDAGFDGEERDFYGRQLKDWKGSFEVEGARPEGMRMYGQLCGWTLARAH